MSTVVMSTVLKMTCYLINEKARAMTRDAMGNENWKTTHDKFGQKRAIGRPPKL
uniref:Uncharacterized protein n=1 Tax=Romanomermis culicivorax TaxID=13658 RepID=A0A915HKL2_ROMCU